MRRLKQIGINYVSSVALPGQWVESDLRGYMDNFKNNGLTLYNLMYVVGADIILARPNRDEEINKIIESSSRRSLRPRECGIQLVCRQTDRWLF
ncbi:MAG: hypothetical protein IPO69_02700 [Saprospiraceae bacterium]|nr:hypothetical protein [Saprospiraceae bacterium]